MTKSELKTGMVVQYRNGNRRMVLRSAYIIGSKTQDLLVGAAQTRFAPLDGWDENLKHRRISSLDIVAVFAQPFAEDSAYNCDFDEFSPEWNRIDSEVIVQ